MIALRSFVFNVLFYATLIVLMILGLPTVLMGRHAVFFMARLWGEASLWLLEHICGLRVEFRGLENIPQGGYIIAAKHQSFLETFSLLRHAPDFAYVLKRELKYIPLFGWYLWGAEQIAIDRSRGKNALAVLSEKALAVLRAGRQIFIFPEGTRRPPGAPPQYKFGVAYLYADSGAPCLPVALNTGLYWGRRGFERRPGVAVIEYLPPIGPGVDREIFLALLQEKIEAACARLNAEALAKDSTLAPRLAAAQT
ncbi:MAG TPA: lysophospholipid acyltransferase family protein [Roseiarcus sp.]|nr:lysophospholipid acyltransferase family protein [Roseiarcus sp.]